MKSGQVDGLVVLFNIFDIFIYVFDNDLFVCIQAANRPNNGLARYAQNLTAAFDQRLIGKIYMSVF